MKCNKCGHDINKSNAKFCPNCGEPFVAKTEVINNDSDKNKMIIALTAIIIIVIIGITVFYVYSPSMGSTDTYSSSDSGSLNNNQSAEEVKSSQSTGSWKSIGSFDGSGSGTKTITVPAGQIRIDLSAYPIKNYATNHLYVSGSNGKSASLDWGPRSAVATHSDSISFTSSSETTFSIDYYETVSWQVNVYKYE